MNTDFNSLTPKFNNVLRNIVNNNVAEEIVIKVTKSCITFYYTIKTLVKDIHRKILKGDYCDQCVSNVVNDVTHMRVSFSFDKALIYISEAAIETTAYTIKYLKNMKITKIIEDFIKSINQHRYQLAV